MKCLLITLLCALYHTLGSNHTNSPPSLEIQSFTGAHYSKHSFSLLTRHTGVETIVNNSDIPATPSEQTDEADGRSDNEICLNTLDTLNVQVITNKTSCLAKQTK